MINLISNEEKKKISRDFYLKLISMFFVMLSVSLLIASVAILPAYFLSSAEKNSVNVKLELQKKEPVPVLDENTSKTIEDLKNKLNLIEDVPKKENTFSQKVINQIILKKMPDIKIKEISYQNNQNEGKMINVNGIAPNREVLLSFRRALEDDPSFSKVDLPISNFVKGSNIRFYLSLIPS